jgi:molybdopterin-guanine dinucleotide biosynthesis protein A
VVARAGGQVHPVFCLCRRSVWNTLDAFLAAGGKKVQEWYKTLRFADARFDDQADGFTNINAPGDLMR